WGLGAGGTGGSERERRRGLHPGTAGEQAGCGGSPMLRGQVVSLRPVRESDLDHLWAAHVDIANRGAFFPLGVMSETRFRREFADHGFWQKEEGMLLITGADEHVVGHIEFFRPISYGDCFELSYQLYDATLAGRGYVTEA